MKTKKIICCLFAFCAVFLTSCGDEDINSVDKIVGEYNINVTPNFNIKLGNNLLPITAETIKTTGRVEAVGDNGDVVVMIDGVQGEFSEISFDGYYDGLRLKLENNHYEGTIHTKSYGAMYCDITLKNPQVSVYNSTSLSWESTVSGTCNMNFSGVDNMRCDISGKIIFEALEK